MNLLQRYVPLRSKRALSRFLKDEIAGLVEKGYEGDVPVMKVSAPDETDGQLSHHLLYVEEALMLFRACLGPADARQTVTPAKAAGRLAWRFACEAPATGPKRPTDLPSMAHFSLNTGATQMDDDDDDDAAQSGLGMASESSLAASIHGDRHEIEVFGGIRWVCLLCLMPRESTQEAGIDQTWGGLGIYYLGHAQPCYGLS